METHINLSSFLETEMRMSSGVELTTIDGYTEVKIDMEHELFQELVSKYLNWADDNTVLAFVEHAKNILGERKE